MPDTLIVIRAGATDYESLGRIRGVVDIPLCAAGIVEAEAAAAALADKPCSAVYAAGELAALGTARIVGRALGIKPRPVPTLHNLDQGLWQGLLVEDIRRRQPRLYRQWQDNPWAVAPPKGELLEQACERVERALEKILRRHGDGRVAIVVPAPLDRIVRWLVAGESMGDLWEHAAGADPWVELPAAAQWSRRPAADRPPATPIRGRGPAAPVMPGGAIPAQHLRGRLV